MAFMAQVLSILRPSVDIRDAASTNKKNTDYLKKNRNFDSIPSQNVCNDFQEASLKSTV